MFILENGRKNRIVVKIGSSSLTNLTEGLSLEKLENHVAALANLRHAGHEVILVSSGAVAAGFTALGYPTRPVTLEGKQAAAAVGQGLLIQAYNDCLRRHGLTGAQILLTRNDFSKRHRYHNAYGALNVLLKRGIVPIINENDTVSVDELTFGDNDMLSALVAALLHADGLIILTDTDGLYTANPHLYPEAKKIERVNEITPEIEEIAGDSGTAVGTGGMRSKISAAKLALSLGIDVFIGTGSGDDKLLAILNGNGAGTYFSNDIKGTLKSRKQWIAFHAESSGKIKIDDGAVKAMLEGHKSLLPSGVVEIQGHFKPGQVIEVWNTHGHLIGKGEVNYSAEQLALVKGKSTSVSREMLRIERAEVIHRDNWVTLYVQENKGEPVT